MTNIQNGNRDISDTKYSEKQRNGYWIIEKQWSNNECSINTRVMDKESAWEIKTSDKKKTYVKWERNMHVGQRKRICWTIE